MNEVILGMLSGLKTCAFTVVPSIFPFMVASDILITVILSEKNLNLSPKFLLFTIGNVCGFPIGATVAESLHKNNTISLSTAKKMLPWCNSASIAFIVGAIGISLFKDVRIGWIIYASVLISSAIPIFFIKSKKCFSEKAAPDLPLSDTIIAALEKSVNNILKTCSLICIFSVVIAILEKYICGIPLIILSAILEISNGTALAATQIGSNALAVALCAFCCGWSGICVHMQILCVSRSIKVKYFEFALQKLLHGALSFFIAFILYSVIFS